MAGPPEPPGKEPAAKETAAASPVRKAPAAAKASETAAKAPEKPLRCGASCTVLQAELLRGSCMVPIGLPIATCSAAPRADGQSNRHSQPTCGIGTNSATSAAA